jgi:hypothetical protein
VSYNKTINDFQFDGYQDLLTQEYNIYQGQYDVLIEYWKAILTKDGGHDQ